MKKRILSAFIALALALTFLPTGVMALDPSPEAEDLPFLLLEPKEGEDPPLPTTGLGPELALKPESTVPEFVPGVVPEEIELTYPSYKKGPVSIADTNDESEKLPTKFDTREGNSNNDPVYQSSVKNQGSNGLCWTFGAYAALEAQAKLKGLGELDFSELHMAYSTSDHSGNTLQGFDRAPGDGGNRYYSSDYLMRGTALSGTIDESSDPYKTTAIGDRLLSESENKTQTYTAQNILFLTGGSKADSSKGEVDAIKRAIQQYGGVAASMYWQGQTTATDGEENQTYYNAATNSYYYYGTATSTNHLVEIAGWDDGYEWNNFNGATEQTGKGAWLVKNSWGEDWGDGGYVWISYADKNFPINAFCFEGIEAYNNNAIVYETDYKFLGASTWLIDSEKKPLGEAYFAKVYTTKTANEVLKSVRFFTTTACTTIEAGYYAFPANATDLTGYKFASKGAVEDPMYPGWYTITFDEPLQLGAAESQFAVVIRLVSIVSTDSDTGAAIGYDKSNALPTDTSAYRSSSGQSWSKATYNYCIKAVTTQTDADQAAASRAASDLTWDTIKGENAKQEEVRTNLTLPNTFRGAIVAWTSTNTAVATDGSVARPVGDGVPDVSGTLTATITMNGATATKTFDLTVKAIPKTDKDAVDKADITWDDIKGSDTDTVSSVMADLKLNDVTKSFKDNGFTVTWESSIPAVINPTDILDADTKEVITPAGKVTQPRFDKKNTVILTATVKKGEAEKTFTFNLAVPNKPSTTEDIYAATFEWLRADLTNHFWPLIKGDNAEPSQIRTNLTAPTKIEFTTEKGEPLSVLVYECEPINTAKDKWNCVGSTGAVTRPDFGQGNSAGYFRIWIKSDDNGYIGTYTLLKLTVLAYQGELKGVTVNSVSVEAGQTAVLTADVNYTDNPGETKYQWYKTDANNSTAELIQTTNTAELSLAGLSVGTYYYYCVVTAQDAAETVTSDVATVTVEAPDPASTSTSLTVSPASATYSPDNTVILTATVTGSTDVKSGTVTLQGSADDLQGITAVQTLNGTNTATWTLTGLTAGPHSFTAEYTPASDDSDHKASTSSTVTVTIAKATPEITNVSASGTIYTSTDPKSVTLTYDGISGTIRLADSVTGFTAGTGTYAWEFTPDDTTNYTTATGTVSITAAAVAVNSITVKTDPTRMSYVYGEAFDPAGMVITVTYNNGATNDISYSAGSGIAVSSSDLGDVGTGKSVTVTYENVSTTLSGIAVTAKPLADGMVTLAQSSYTYDGNTKTPAVTVTDGAKALVSGTDYEVTYANNQNAGTAVVTVTGQGNYSGTINKTFTIAKARPSITSISVFYPEIIYISTSPSGVMLTYEGTPAGGTVTLDSSVTEFTQGKNDYPCTFTPSDADKDNYDCSNLDLKVSITAQTIAITGISVTKQPDNKTYTYGGVFDPTGMEITVTYADNSTTVIGEPYTGVTFSDLGDVGTNRTVTVFYEGHEATVEGITVEPAEPGHNDHSLPLTFDNTKPQTVGKGAFGITEDGVFTLKQGAAITNSDRLKDGTVTISGDSISFELAAGGTAPTGPVAIEIPLTFTPSSKNYMAIDVTLTISLIAKTSVPLTASAYTRIYNGREITMSELLGSLSSGGVEGTWTFTDNTDLPKNASGDPYLVGLTFTPKDTEEYAAGKTTISITINPAVITVTAVSKTVTRNDAMPKFTYTVSGLLAGDSWVDEPVIICTATSTAATGTFPITVSGGDAGGNYTITYVNGTLTVRAPANPPTPSTGGDSGTTAPVQTGSTTQGGSTTTQTTATPSATTSGGRATTVVNTATANEIVRQAAANGSEKVVIAPVINGNVTKTEVTIPASAIGEIGRSTRASLTISTPMADVTIPNSGLSGLSSVGGSVTVTAEKNGNKVDFTVTANGRTVISVPGGVTLSVPMEQTTPGTVAVLVREDGTREVIRKSMADAGGISIPLNGSAKVEIIDNSKIFTDVAPDNWAADAVAFVSAHELFVGTDDGIFSPRQSMSRGMLAVALHNLESNPEAVFHDTFTDVRDDAWYAEGVSWAVSRGIVVGYGDGSFGANDPITREQMVVMLWAYFGSPAAVNRELNFTDAGRTSTWALEAMCWAVENGIVSGYGDGILDPDGTATRAQVAKLLQNLLSR